MAKKKGGKKEKSAPLAEDMYDEVDLFHKDDDSASLDDGRNSDEEPELEALADLDDSEDDSDADLEAGGTLAKGVPLPGSTALAVDTCDFSCCESSLELLGLAEAPLCCLLLALSANLLCSDERSLEPES